MANFNFDLTPRDKREGSIIQMVSPVYTGVDHLKVHSPNILNIPQLFIPRSIQVVLTTSADVANRVIAVRRYNELVSTQIFGINRNAITASNTNKLYIIDGAWTASAASFDDSIVGVNTHFLEIGNKNYLDVFIYDGQAADSWYAVIDFKYVNRKYNMPEVLPDSPDPRGSVFSAPVPQPKGGK